jgi:hypothetical protein
MDVRIDGDGQAERAVHGLQLGVTSFRLGRAPKITGTGMHERHWGMNLGAR